MSRSIRVYLSDESSILVEETSPPVEQEVSSGVFEGNLADILPSVVVLCRDFAETLRTVAPDKATVQFGLKLAVESTGLTALVGKFNTDANFQITLEWNSSNSTK